MSYLEWSALGLILILFELFIAYDLPSDFPKTVNAAITALNNTLTKIEVPSANCLITIAAPHAPLMIAQMSPIISAHTDATFSAFLASFTAVFAPFTFLADIDKNG